jgi:hypothetical protein
MSGWKSGTSGVKKSLVEALGLPLAEISERLRTQVVPAMKAEWERLIRTNVAPHRQNRMLEGIRISQHNLSLTLQGWDAVRTERGWIPMSYGNIFTAGLGKYTPGRHSLIPAILGLDRYRVIKFESNKTVTQTVEHYRKLLAERGDSLYRDVNIEEATAAFKKRLTLLKKTRSPAQVYTLDTSDLILPKLAQKHHSSIFERMSKVVRSSGRGYVLTIYRTMAYYHWRRLWITKGTPPANTIPALMDKLPQILYEAFFKGGAQ